MIRILNKHKANTSLKKKVFVGLSGGVDSAVSAALLKEEGYEVTGVFIKAWTPPGYPCTWKDDRRSAMRVAAVLDIPFITLDLEKEYKEGVVDYMISEYKLGRTPNPDVMCNKEIKFGSFLNWAKKQGADFIATGHYAQKIDGGGSQILSEAKDKNKDQSYFLWTLDQEQLSHTLFPVGGLQKSEVRELARKFKLPQATRKDSQGLCFLGQVDMKEFLSNYIEKKTGDVLNTSGEVIGSHNGAVFFTIGERHGFDIKKKGPNDEPLYVISKDVDKNIITVDSQNSSRQGLLLHLDHVNWIVGVVPKEKNLQCRLRYRQKKIGCSVESDEREIKVTLDEAIPYSPGQSLVIYLPAGRHDDSEMCLGGGIMR